MEKKTFDAAALGELLVDFTQRGVSGQGNPLFEANPGGAPCNVLAMLCRLGRRCAFLGKVGRDPLGAGLARAAGAAGIDLRGLRFDPRRPTTLAFVHNRPDGEREFSFCRRGGADAHLTAEELDAGALESCRVFHFGSLSLTHAPCREATRRAVELARAAGALLSFDPNLRPPLWDSLEQAREQIDWGLGQCQVLKIADDELRFVTGLDGLEAGAAALLARCPDLRLMNVTAGAAGSHCFWDGGHLYQPACPFGEVTDTTGAGDAFCACALDFVLERGLEGLDEARLRDMLRFASAAAWLVTTRKGALGAMPRREQVEQVLDRWERSG